MWSAGCIFAELAAGSPLFEESSEFGLLMTIFQRLGTPSKSFAPGLCGLEYYKAEFPRWQPRELTLRGGALGASGLAALRCMLSLDPTGRPQASGALGMAYFNELCPRRREAFAMGLLPRAGVASPVRWLGDELVREILKLVPSED